MGGRVCRKCGVALRPYINWADSRILRHDYICKECDNPRRDSQHWTRHKHKILDERIGFLDIETSNLKATFGFVFCYCIADQNTKKITGARITKKDLHGKIDKRILVQFLKDLGDYDRVVTYYGAKFDIPFLRTRCLYHQLPFPEYGEIYHTDLYYIVRNKLQLHRNTQEIATRFLIGESEKTHYGQDHWLRGMTGNERALRYIYDHCKRDVRDLKKLYEILMFQRGYSRRGM